MTDDLKELLGRALGEEPPLRIDREAVLQQGRKRLRRKRLIDTGSVVAAVVVAVVGATTLTKLVDSEPERMPPAASSTQPAPPGPQLPITTPGRPRSEAPPSVETSNTPLPSNTINGTDALRLTGLLYATGVVSKDNARLPSGKSGTPQFALAKDRYVYDADIVGQDGQGYVQVVVGYTSDIPVDCASVIATESVGDCKVRNKDDVRVAVSHTKNQVGVRQTNASAMFSSGVRVVVTAWNTSMEGSKSGKPPLLAEPVLTEDEVCVLITKVGTVA